MVRLSCTFEILHNPIDIFILTPTWPSLFSLSKKIKKIIVYYPLIIRILSELPMSFEKIAYKIFKVARTNILNLQNF